MATFSYNLAIINSASTNVGYGHLWDTDSISLNIYWEKGLLDHLVGFFYFKKFSTLPGGGELWERKFKMYIKDT
jgi:hypothetical protein